MISEDRFYEYIRRGTRLAPLAYAGSVMLLIAIAATGKSEKVHEISFDQIQPICQHILCPLPGKSGDFCYTSNLYELQKPMSDAIQSTT